MPTKKKTSSAKPSAEKAKKKKTSTDKDKKPVAEKAKVAPPRIRHRRVLRDNIQGITRPVIARLAHRGGVRRLQSYVYEEIRGVMKVTMENILRAAVAFAMHNKVKTLKVEHLRSALSLVNRYMAIGLTKDGKNVKNCKPLPKDERTKDKEVIEDEIRYQQENSDCLVIARISFSRLTREIAQDFMMDLRFTKQFIDTFQFCVEHHITHIFRLATLCATHAHRSVVKTSDIQLVRRILAHKDMF